MEDHFKIKYCELCESIYVECPKCGNNCCNGGSGEVDGEQCDFCKWSYEFQDLVWCIEWAVKQLPYDDPEKWPEEEGFPYNKVMHQKTLEHLRLCEEEVEVDKKEQEILKRIFNEAEKDNGDKDE